MGSLACNQRVEQCYGECGIELLCIDGLFVYCECMLAWVVNDSIGA